MISLTRLLISTTLLLFVYVMGVNCFASEETSYTGKMTLWNPAEGPHLRGMVIHPCMSNSIHQNGDPYCTEEKKLKKKDLQDLRDLNANFVNASYPGLFHYSAPYGLNTETQHDLDNLITWTEEIGLYVVISARTGPGRNESAIMAANKRTKYYGRHANWDIWKHEKTQKKYIEMWRYTANRYKSHKNIIGYSIMVEPHPGTQKSNKYTLNNWEKLAHKITKAIREVDQETPIIIESTNWANTQTFYDLFITGDNRTVYSFHSYNPDSYSHQDQDGTVAYLDRIDVDDDGSPETFDLNLIEEMDFSPVFDFSQKYKVPVFAGEFGTVRWVPNASAYHRDVISLFEKYGWNYSAYVWRNNDNDSDNDYIYDGFDLEYGPDPGIHYRKPDNPLLNAHMTGWKNNTHFYKHE